MQRELTYEDSLVRAWWLIAFVGLASVVAGGILVAKPSHSLATLAVVLGIFVLLDGIAELVTSFGHDVENRALAAIVGVLGIIVGAVLIRHPTHAVAAIGLLIGIWLLAAGVVRLVVATAVPGHRLLRVAIALLEIAVGIAVVADPHIGYATLAVLTGIWLVINGKVLLALAIRTAGSALSAPPRPSASARPPCEVVSESPALDDATRPHRCQCR